MQVGEGLGSEAGDFLVGDARVGGECVANAEAVVADKARLGKAKAVSNAASTEDAIREALSADDTVSLFVQFADPDNARFELLDGSGLRSVVMWDPRSSVKFANNEPYRPNFKASQINTFHEEHGGDGIQHLALEVSDILTTVRRLRARGVEFMRTPGTYYDALPQRLEELAIGALDEDLNELRELEITQAKLVESSQLVAMASRQAGMAEIATGILHNVGNVLNSVNVCGEVALGHARALPATGFERLCELWLEQPDLDRLAVIHAIG